MNGIDYEFKTNQQLSSTFSNRVQNKLVTDAILWLGKHRIDRNSNKNTNGNHFCKLFPFRHL
jgi:hypothetical protein